jgi:carboxyl-terminal processing protease
MSSKSRWLIFVVSTPLVIVALIGGLMGAAPGTPQQSFKDLPVFEDVIGLIMSSYVDRVDIDKVMEGAMRGLADGLDPSSAYLSPEEVQAVETKARPPAGDVGLVLSRQFYLRVIGVRDGSPAARAGIRTGDVIRAIDGKPTREISAFTGTRMLSGAPGTKVELVVLRESAVEPHTVVLDRQPLTGDLVTGKRLPSGEAYVRVASFGAGAATGIRRQLEALRQAGAASAVIDVRGTADGPADEAVSAARLFIASGALSTLAGRTPTDKTVTSAAAGDGAITMPIVLLTSNGTANAAEIFAAALVGHKRADLVGEPTAGIAAQQRLVKLPEGRGLWMTYARYLTTDGKPIHEHGLAPTVAVEEPTVTFGAAPPATDDALTKALEVLKTKAAPKAA